MAKKQGYDDREDESLGMRTGKEADKKQSMKDRRDESYGKWGTRDEKGDNKVNKSGKDDKKKKSKGSDVDKSLEEYDRTAQEAAMAELGDAPMASRPLTPKRVNALAQTVTVAIEDLSDGQINLGESVTINEEVDSLPPQLWQQVSAFAQIPEMVGIEEYAFNPGEEAKTDDGLLRMANKIDKMANDKKVKNAMSAPTAPTEEVVGEEVTVGPDEISEEEFAAMA